MSYNDINFCHPCHWSRIKVTREPPEKKWWKKTWILQKCEFYIPLGQPKILENGYYLQNPKHLYIPYVYKNSPMKCAVSGKWALKKKRCSLKYSSWNGYENKLDRVMALARNQLQVENKKAIYIWRYPRSQSMTISKMRLSHVGRDEGNYQLSFTSLVWARHWACVCVCVLILLLQ